MATSGSTDYALTARQIISAALELCGVIQMGETPSAEEAAAAMTHLNLLLKTWSTDPKIFLEAEASVSLVASTASYTLSAARRVSDVCRRDSNSRDTPLGEIDGQTYFNLPNKTSTGTPTTWYFDPQRATRTLYVWPVPDATAAAAYTLRYSYQRVIEDIDALGNNPDVPQEWLEALTYSLAARLCLPFGVFSANPTQAAKIEERAAQLYDQLATDDRQGASVFITSDR